MGDDVVEFNVVATTTSDKELVMLGLVKVAGTSSWLRTLNEVHYPVLEWPEFGHGTEVAHSVALCSATGK